MLANLGFFLLFVCCLVTCYGVMASLAAARYRHRRLFRSAQMAMTVVCVLCTIASLILWYQFFQRDYSVAYILKNSSNDLPIIYTFTAFWSSLEGSHLLWTLFMSICGLVCVWTYAKDNEHIMPYVSATIQAVLAWMFYLCITHSDPFAVSLPSSPDGRGMNALLQNPYMAIHPPLLFVGYTTLVVPFAYAMAALCYGDVTEGWVKTTRRWALVAWVFLTAGIALGGRWAYVELGWAGYWAWDPVENSSFMPWLFGTALLHSLLVQEKLGHLKRLSIVLAVLAFFMTFLGTFITRSGVITSVHSFAESPIGPTYLLFLAVLLLICALIYAVRAHSILPPDTDKVWGVSKESALMVTQFLLLSFAAIVLVGTLFPILSEYVTDQRISVQGPYFNAFAPYIGVALMVAIAFGNIMHFQSPKVPDGAKIILGSVVIALPLTGLLMYFGNVTRDVGPYAFWSQVIGMFLACWAASCLSWDGLKRWRRFSGKTFAFFRFNTGYIGAYVAHIGFLVCMIGFLGNYRGLDVERTLAPGDSFELYGYTFTALGGIQPREHLNATFFEVPILVEKGGLEITTMRPAQTKYPTSTELMFEIAVHTGFWYDLYAVLVGFDRHTFKEVTVQMNVNPTVKMVWWGVILMCIGGGIAVLDRRRGQRSRDVTAGAWELGTAGRPKKGGADDSV